MCWSAESRAVLSIQALPICAMSKTWDMDVYGVWSSHHYGKSLHWPVCFPFSWAYDHPFVWKVDEDKHVFMNQNPGTLQTNSSQTMVFHHRFWSVPMFSHQRLQLEEACALTWPFSVNLALLDTKWYSSSDKALKSPLTASLPSSTWLAMAARRGAGDNCISSPKKTSCISWVRTSYYHGL